MNLLVHINNLNSIIHIRPIVFKLLYLFLRKYSSAGKYPFSHKPSLFPSLPSKFNSIRLRNLLLLLKPLNDMIWI